MRRVGHLIFKRKMPVSSAHERCLDHLIRNSMRKAPCGYFAFCKAHWEGQRPRCPIRRHTGNEDVAPLVWLNPCAKLLADGVAKFCAKLTGRRFAALEPSGAAGWAVKVLHGTHGVRRGISVREAADRRWRSRADETLIGAPNERRNAVRAPKTPSRPSPCGAPRARVVPEP